MPRTDLVRRVTQRCRQTASSLEEEQMRKVVIALGVMLVAVLAVGTAAAKPHGGGGGGGAPMTVAVAGTFTSLGIQVPFSGALAVDRFDVVDNQLAVEGELTAGEEVCGVLKASDKDPFDQHAIARALNRALGVS
jgi:hypothetical protein